MATTEDFWIGTSNANWTTASNWSYGSGSGHATPTSTQDAFLAYKGAGVTVESDLDQTVNSIGTSADSELLIASDSTFIATNGTTLNSGDSGTTASGNGGNITVANGSVLEIGQGTFDNSGTVELTSSGVLTSFSVVNSLMLTGSGTIEMSPNADNFIKGAGGASSLTNVNNTISGGGQIGAGANALAFTNDSGGTIETNNSLGTGTLQIVGSSNGGSFTNNGVVEANNGGTLVFGQDGQSSSLANNAGTIELDSTGNTTKLEIAGNVTINGSSTGTILMGGSGASNDRILSDGNTASLTLTNQTLKGAGTVGDSHLTLNVQSGSTVAAEISGETLVLSTGNNAINNAGLMESTDFGSTGGELALESLVDNTGTILAASGTVSVLDGITGSGAVQIGTGGDLFTDTSIAGNVTFTASGGELTLDNTMFNGGIAGAIAGAVAGDTIDLEGVTFAAGEHAVWHEISSNSGTLSINRNGSDLYSQLILDGTYNSLDFAVGSDGASGSLITVQNTPTYAENPGNNDEWILSDGNWVESAGPGSHPSGYNVAGTGDWTGNGTDGILWFNPTTGDTDEWQLSNTQWSASVDLGTHPANSTDGASYQVAGTDATTDFFGNGIGDVLWTSTNANGTIATDIWQLNSSGQWTPTPGGSSPGTHPAGYTVAGTGDWTGDGTDGILWFNPTTGDTDEWQLSNGKWSGSVDLGTHPANSTDGNAYQIAGVGDFLDNGRDDVMWTSVNSDGTVATDIWELGSNGKWTASVSLGAHPAGYQVVGISDFRGTGTDDILWQNTTTGDIDEWQLSGGKWAASVDLGAHPGNTPVSGVGDFTGTGTSDILFHS